MAKKPAPDIPIGEILRLRRMEQQRGLRETAKLLSVAPAHLTDIEKGRRNPSDDLLMRICRVYGIDEAELRSGWNKPQAIVGEIASQDATAAAKVPELLRSARRFTSAQWDTLIQQAQRMAAEKTRKPD